MKKDTNIIDLKGIAFEEIDSILQFIYLGEAAICEGRMKEFLYVAQKLKIKELSKEGEMTFDIKNETETQLKDHIQTVTVNEVVRYASNQYDKQSQYACNQCDYQATYSMYDLEKHVKSIHEGVKYSCNQCDKQFKTQSNVARHFQSVHKSVKYSCNKCNFQTTLSSSLKVHIQSKHDGVK